MELILKTNNEQSIAKIIALAKRLNVVVEKKVLSAENDKKESLKNQILNFKSTFPSSFGDAENWQKEQRNDRKLPFS